ncbi:MAG: transposase [Candidatus Dormibacteria bacterium]
MEASVGVELGCTPWATLSKGEEIVGPRAYGHLMACQPRLAGGPSRKQKGSRNRDPLRLARHHLRAANIRRDGPHHLATALTRRFPTMGIEDLKVAGMSRHHALARSIAAAETS